MKKSNKPMFMMFTFLMLVTAVFYNLSNVSKAAINDEDDSNITYTTEYASSKTNGSTLEFTKDTIFVMDSNSDKYFKGIRIKYGKTLKIQLKGSGNLYTYGSQPDKPNTSSNGASVAYPGIYVPSDSRLIIEQTSNNAGYLVAVGGCATTKSTIPANGTAAGIGGCGYSYYRAVSGNFMSDHMVSAGGGSTNCGTIIIKSGVVFACGGSAVATGSDDAHGTGAGIGGGGVYFYTHDDDDYTVVNSGKAGVVKIFGGYVFAIGGGTAYSTDSKTEKNSIYYHLRDFLFNPSNGFSSCEKKQSNKKAEGTGAG
ncbi:MAG: hypothetical protein J6Y29_03735, partial [Clostridiales bacterium]|nr:hypothetical protein [Clostridiales bacterium]